MIPVNVQNGILLISIGALALTIIVNLFSSGRKWGQLKSTVVQHGEVLDGINNVLFREDSTPNFITRHDFEEHTKKCPILICAKINDVKSLVQVTAEKLESSRFMGVRLEEGMKRFDGIVAQQQEMVTKLDASIDALQLQVAVLRQADWDGRERRDIVRTKS